MKKKNWLLFTAGFLYPLPFLAADYFWWVTFLFPLPLLYLGTHHNVSFKDGYMWGLITFSLHLSGVLYSVINMAEGSLLLAFIPAFFIIAYQSLYAGLLFWISTKINNFKKLEPGSVYRTLVWVGTLSLYIFYFDRYCLWLFDRLEGYFLMHPLLPLAQQPQLLRLLPIFGKPLLTLLLFAPATLLVASMRYKKMFFGFGLSCLIWCAQFFAPLKKLQQPVWLQNIGYLQKTFSKIPNLSLVAETMEHDFKALAHKYPDVELIVMPESSLFVDCISTTPELCSYWDEQHISRPLNLILGAFRWNDTRYHNTLHWIANGKLEQLFDKRHTMILTERAPSLFNLDKLNKLYFSKMPQVDVSHNPRPLLPLLSNQSFVPYICSEILFNENPDDDYPDKPILSINNDDWTIDPFVPKLMLLNAQFKAIQWQRDIVYVSYKHAHYLNKHGQRRPLSKTL